MPPGQHPCPTCGNIIGNASKRCRFCGVGEPAKHHAGYKQIWSPGHPLASRNGYVLEHRYVLWEAGIDIPAGSHVHHRNGNKTDNRIENLEVKSASRHHEDHVREGGDRITNQYGVFPVLRDEEARRKRLSEWNRRRVEYKREWRRRKVQEQRNAIRGEDINATRGSESRGSALAKSESKGNSHLPR